MGCKFIKDGKKYQYKEEIVRSVSGEIKQGVSGLFESNLELANQVYSKILANSGISGENLLSLLLKDKIVEKQCS